MVLISNSQRDEAVRYLQALAEMESDNRDLKVVNLCRLSRRLAKQLKKKQSL
jgi:hypothetical protein